MADYKIGDVIYSNRNLNVFKTKILYARTPLKVIAVNTYMNGCSYVVEFVDKHGKVREWDSISDVYVISPTTLQRSRELDEKVALILDGMGEKKGGI